MGRATYLLVTDCHRLILVGTNLDCSSQTQSQSFDSLAALSIVNLDLELVDELRKYYITIHDELDSPVFLAEQFGKTS